MGVTEANQNDEAAQIRRNHGLHWLALLALAAYAWQLHGILTAFVLLLGLLILIGGTNMFLLMTTGNIRATRWSRWGWLAVAGLGVVISGAEIGSV